MAVGEKNILTSLDGITWTSQTYSAGKPLYDVAWSGTQFLAVGPNGTIVTSLDGITWTAQTLHPSQNFASVTWSDHQFVVVGGSSVDGANSPILTSPDGRVWTSQNSETMEPLFRAA